MQNRFRKVQETLARPLLPGSKRPFAPSRNHFREFPIFDPLSQAAWFATLVVPFFWKGGGGFGHLLVSRVAMGSQESDVSLNKAVRMIVDCCGGATTKDKRESEPGALVNNGSVNHSLNPITLIFHTLFCFLMQIAPSLYPSTQFDQLGPLLASPPCLNGQVLST